MRSKLKPALLALEDGSLFQGQSCGAEGIAVGEVVFNTAITGYQEILTDPSYARQIVTLTYPQIGNTGVNPEDVESARVSAAGLVIRQLPRRASSWRQRMTLPEFLREQGVVAVADVDTRRLTKLVRRKGALAGCIAAGDVGEAEAVARAQAFPGLKGMDLATAVSCKEPYAWTEGAWVLGKGYSRGATVDQEGGYGRSEGHGKGKGQGREEGEGRRQGDGGRLHVVAYDFGVKRNILRMLAARGCRVTVVPAATGADEVAARRPDGVFLSNGPGDPQPCAYAIEAIAQLLEMNLPIFGICLGHQLLALASGAATVKMPHGHHGANHPVQDLDTRQVIITSQNHGFAVDGDSLPNNLRATHISLFDGTLQGIARTDKPAFSFQGHPEASPGPKDCGYLFDRFVGLMAATDA